MPPTSGTVAPADRPASSARPARALLADCCRRHAAVTIAALDDDTIFRGSFVTLEGDVLAVEASRACGDAHPVPTMLLCLLFSDGNGSCVGLFSLRRSEDIGEDRHRFLLAAADEIATAQGRAAYRVAVDPDAGLRVVLGLRDGRQLPVAARDISVSGISVALGEPGAPLRRGHSVSVSLSLDGESVVIPALARRVREREAALWFHSSAAPPQLRRIVTGLEARLLRERVRTSRGD